MIKAKVEDMGSTAWCKIYWWCSCIVGTYYSKSILYLELYSQILSLDYGVSSDDIKVMIISLFFLYFAYIFYLAWPWIFTLNFSMRHGGDIWEFVRNPCSVLFVASVCIVWERPLILFYLQRKKVGARRVAHGSSAAYPFFVYGWFRTYSNKT